MSIEIKLLPNTTASVMKPVQLVTTVVLILVFLNGSQAASPHIVFIVADDLGWNDIGFRNPQVLTPHLDKLAKAGVILNSSYVQPVCSPSRNCFMTGYFPYHTGLQDGIIRPTSPGFVPIKFTFLPQKLKELGYSTHAVGKWHVGFCNIKYTPTYRGFDTFVGYYTGAEEYYNHTRGYDKFSGYDLRFNTSVYTEAKGKYSTHVFAERAVDIIKSHDKNTPLYLYLPFQAVHAPLEVPPEYEKLNDHIHNLTRRTYCGMISALDEAVANITNALEETGLIENLLLVFTTDNGGPFHGAANNLPLRGTKATLWEGGTKGTGFIYSKSLLKKTGYLNTGMMHAVDWYPTLVELAGGKNTDPNMDGVSQYDMLINGGPSKRNEFVYNIYDKTNSSAIRYGDLKLMRGSPGAHSGWVPLPTSGESSDTQDSQFQFPPYMLYNITSDPTEHFDLSAKYPELVTMMKQRLENWEKTRVPAYQPPNDPKSNPDLYGGNWSPGWC
ncbi:arylsulfatase B-like [Haliotis rubra]|uniref:arylsulfatase B-like n=1 Tax=Haliotis rubra TaxID=36100 RepID=UPI001EE52D8C|nr:arylsulfatase B-like [Haliotis rubra]